MSSDNIPQLSYNGTLNGAEIYYSDPVILGQYISVSLLVAADQDLTITLQFSADGIHYDYSVSRNWLIGTNDLLIQPVTAKWTRLRITNNSLLATTYTRVITYGTPSNSSLVAQISKIGNLDPSVNVSNLPIGIFGDLSVAQTTPQVQHLFSQLVNGNIYPRTYVTPDQSINSFSSDSTGTVANINSCMEFGSGLSYGEFATIWGASSAYYPGQGLKAEFSFGFLQQAKAPTDAPTTQWIGIGNVSSNEPFDFVGFGFDSSYGDWDADEYNLWGAVYKNSNAVSTEFIPHTLFNVDKADGTFVLPDIDVSKMQVGRIRIGHLGYSSIEWSIQNPTTGLWQVVHVINRCNSFLVDTNFQSPSMQMIAYQNTNGGTPASSGELIRCASFAIFLEGPKFENYQRAVFFGEAACDTGLVPPYTNLLAVRCESTWYSLPNNVCIDIDSVSFAVNTATKDVDITIYKNSTIGGAWDTTYNPRLPASSTYLGAVSNVGTPVFRQRISSTNYSIVDLTPYHIHLNPGENVAIVGTSTAAANIYVTMSAKIH